MKTKEIIWVIVGTMAIILTAEVGIIQSFLYSIFSGFILGIWLGWTSSLLKWKD